VICVVSGADITLEQILAYADRKDHPQVIRDTITNYRAGEFLARIEAAHALNKHAENKDEFLYVE